MKSIIFALAFVCLGVNASLLKRNSDYADELRGELGSVDPLELLNGLGDEQRREFIGLVNNACGSEQVALSSEDVAAVQSLNLPEGFSFETWCSHGPGFLDFITSLLEGDADALAEIA